LQKGEKKGDGNVGEKEKAGYLVKRLSVGEGENGVLIEWFGEK